MESEKRRGRGWWALAGAVLLPPALLLGGYVGAYYALVDSWSIPITMFSSPIAGRKHASYPSDWMSSFFEPMHQIDRKWIRPTFWKSP